MILDTGGEVEKPSPSSPWAIFKLCRVFLERGVVKVYARYGVLRCFDDCLFPLARPIALSAARERGNDWGYLSRRERDFFFRVRRAIRVIKVVVRLLDAR